MDTIKTLEIKLSLTKPAIYNRINKLGLEKRYETVNNKVMRVFTEGEVKLLENYKPEKPGRKVFYSGGD